MSYVSGTCSIIHEDKVCKLNSIGFALRPNGYLIEGYSDYVKADIKIHGFEMPCETYKLKVLDGPRAGELITLKHKGVSFLTDKGSDNLHGFYRVKGRRESTLLEIVSIREDDIAANQYCYSFGRGVFAIGAGSDPVFVYGSFTPHE